MAVVVIIPTFQRPETLVWSLQSVLMQDVRAISPSEELRIVILNNDPGTKDKVEAAVRKSLVFADKHGFNRVTTIHRDPPLLGIFNLYLGLKEYTSDGDIAFLHGDDDIMISGTLVRRYQVARNSNAAFNIGKTSGKMFFFKNDPCIYVDDKEISNITATQLNWRWASKQDLTAYSLPFVSAYCYRMGPEFWSCYNQAKGWADALPLESKIRLPFLPFYIGLAAWVNKCLAVMPEEVVRRGQLLQSRGLLPPRVITEYANTGIILQTGLAVTSNEFLGAVEDLDDVRNGLKSAVSEYLFFSLYRRDGVSLGQLKALWAQTKVSLWRGNFLLRAVFCACTTIAKNIFMLNNLRNRLSGWGRRLSSENFWALWDINQRTNS